MEQIRIVKSLNLITLKKLKIKNPWVPTESSHTQEIKDHPSGMLRYHMCDAVSNHPPWKGKAFWEMLCTHQTNNTPYLLFHHPWLKLLCLMISKLMNFKNERSLFCFPSHKRSFFLWKHRLAVYNKQNYFSIGYQVCGIRSGVYQTPFQCLEENMTLYGFTFLKKLNYGGRTLEFSLWTPLLL